MIQAKKLRIAIVDPYIQEPVPNCYNRLSELLHAPMTIHHPAFHGVDSLSESKPEAVIILGSASHVSQRLAWHQPLAETIDNYLHKKIPVLGLCFGHQLMADFYGGKIDYFKTPEDRLFGVRKVKITKTFGDIGLGSELHLAATHRQTVQSLPDSMESFGVGQDPILEFDFIRHKTLPFASSQPHAEASKYFCIKSAEVPEAMQAQVHEDGARFVQAFFKHYF